MCFCGTTTRERVEDQNDLQELGSEQTSHFIRVLFLPSQTMQGLMDGTGLGKMLTRKIS